jgi:sterol desaturase/sphingolipid hydroxylase (fatty acid hydroxylase superfamily)
MDLIPLSLSYGAAAMAAAFVAVAIWENVRPGRPVAIQAGPRWRVNLTLFAIRKVIAFALAPWVTAVLAALLLGVAILPAPVTVFGAVAHALAVLLALDLGNYVTHRALHAVPWLWRLHAVHHADLDLDVTTSVRAHPVEPILVGLTLGVLGGVLGAQPDEVAAYAALGFTVQLAAHANVRLPQRLQAVLGRW